MKGLVSIEDVLATLAAVAAWHAVEARFAAELVALPAGPFAAASAVLTFSAVKALAAGIAWAASRFGAPARSAIGRANEESTMASGGNRR